MKTDKHLDKMIKDWKTKQRSVVGSNINVASLSLQFVLVVWVSVISSSSGC